MSQPQTTSDPSSEPISEPPGADVPADASKVTALPSTAPPSYVKLAMRNMVRKRGTSLYHFALSTIALLGVLVGLAYLTR